MSDTTTDARITYRTTEEQLARIKDRADQVGVSANEWMNRALDFILDEVPVKSDYQDAKAKRAAFSARVSVWGRGKEQLVPDA